MQSFIFLLRLFRDILRFVQWKSQKNPEMQISNLFRNRNSNNYESLPRHHAIRNDALVKVGDGFCKKITNSNKSCCSLLQTVIKTIFDEPNYFAFCYCPLALALCPFPIRLL